MPVPCQLSVQPPFCLGMLSAPSPATSTFDVRPQRQHVRRRSSAAPAIRALPGARPHGVLAAPSNSNRPAECAGRRLACFEQSRAQFHAQDATHGIVEPRHRNLAGANLRERVLVELLPAVRRHEHVEAGVDRRSAAGCVQPSTWPCAFQSPTMKPSKPMRRLSTSVSRPSWPWILLALPARERCHDDLHAGADGRRVAGAVNVAQLLPRWPAHRPDHVLRTCRRRR